MNRTHRYAGLALAALALNATPAAAQSPIFTEDAEGAPDVKWVVGTPPDSVEPWQKSDSAARKYRGNVFHGGATSFWTGVQPQNWPLVPTTAPAGANVVEGESTLTTKEPVIIPADGQTMLKYWSLFQNEGDDQGLAQVSIVGSDGKPGPFKNVKSETATATSAGDTDPRACDPSRPDHTMAVPFSEQVAPLAGFAGRRVLIRFTLKYGAENRPVSHPCGWYLDDVSVLSTGTPGNLGDAGAPTTPPNTGPSTPAGSPTVKVRSVRLKGRKATLGLTISGGEVSAVKVALLRGKKTVGRGKAAKLAVGDRSVVLKLKRKLKKGSYVVRLTGKAGTGAPVKTVSKVKAR